MARLDGKVTVITGGAGTIGAAAGRLFAEEGSKVLLVDTEKDALEKALRDIGKGDVSYFVADVTHADEVQSYVNAAVDRYGGIDVFLNNAGIEGLVTPIVQYPIEVFDKVMAVNVRGVWLGLKYVIPVMARKQSGSIIISSSTAGVVGSPGISAYNCSKHAVVGIMRTAAIECAPLNIRVNTINPCPVEGRMMDSMEKNFGAMLNAADSGIDPLISKDIILQAIPMRRYATTEEVARMMLFLASDESSICTGGVYMLDGGLTCA
jgi:NAD(P)-dependent dehydrogenase (short-subunit alcohol dehydrogenase family)